MYDSTFLRYLEKSNAEKESRIVLARGSGEGNGELLFSGDSFHLGR